MVALMMAPRVSLFPAWSVELSALLFCLALILLAYTQKSKLLGASGVLVTMCCVEGWGWFSWWDFSFWSLFVR